MVVTRAFRDTSTIIFPFLPLKSSRRKPTNSRRYLSSRVGETFRDSVSDISDEGLIVRGSLVRSAPNGLPSHGFPRFFGGGFSVVFIYFFFLTTKRRRFYLSVRAITKTRGTSGRSALDDGNAAPSVTVRIFR